MRNAAVVARWELRRTIGRKAFLISTATVPVLLAIAVLAVVLFGDRIGGAVAEASTPDAGDSYGLIDRAGALDGRDLPSNFTRFVDEAAARTAEAQGAIAGYFVVAADYEQSGAVRLVADDFGAFGEREGEARGVIRSVLLDALLQEHVAPEIAARIRQPVELRAEGLDGSPPEGAAADSSIDAVLPYAMAMLYLLIIFTSAGYLLEGVSEEKETRVIEIVLSSVTPDQLLLGKLAGQAMTGLVQVLVWVVTALALVPLLLARFDLLGDVTVNFAVLPLAIAYLLLGYLLVAAFYATVGSITTSFKEGQQLAVYVVLPSVVPLMAAAFIQGDPDGLLAVGLSWVPITAPVAGLMRVAAGSAGRAFNRDQRGDPGRVRSARALGEHAHLSHRAFGLRPAPAPKRHRPRRSRLVPLDRDLGHVGQRTTYGRPSTSWVVDLSAGTDATSYSGASVRNFAGAFPSSSAHARYHACRRKSMAHRGMASSSQPTVSIAADNVSRIVRPVSPAAAAARESQCFSGSQSSGGTSVPSA